jgi:hypothetical protein
LGAGQKNGRRALELALRHASAESVLMSDEDSSYCDFKSKFAEHHGIKHSEAFSKPGGIHNNQAESYNWRMSRGDEGIYLAASNKYHEDYAVE